MTRLPELLVVIAHSGIVVPGEIPLDSLSEKFPVLARNVDWYTNWLYDFRDVLDNQQIVFPYCSLILEGNRHPAILEDSVPLRDVHGEPVYKNGREPSDEQRKFLAGKYLECFHRAIERQIVDGAEFLLDGHSTITARGVEDNQIDLMNFQLSPLDEAPRYYCPAKYVETYANELQKRLPDVRVTVNSSDYYTVYGHVCAEHSVNAMSRVGKKVPAFIQETNERLYKNPDKSPNVEAINGLRRIFAEAFSEAYRKTRRE
ncbi:MAG: N-formylglutamate amidohydrolase [Deltaproteobacteria bacterium]|nr:N-formylglutamate amidohydrolase [Deltaproteobacteria bacterium]